MRWQTLAGFLALVVLGAVRFPCPATGGKVEKDAKLWVFVGTYTDAKSKGIYRCELDLASGKLSEPVLAVETKNPSFLAIHPSKRFLYAVGEQHSNKESAVSAFSLDPKTGALKFLNEESPGGKGPCHLVVDKAGKNVLAANYGGGSCCCLPIGDDGKLGEAFVVQHKGKGTDPKRQEGPHAHSINLDAANRFAFVADLGLDKELMYRFDPAKGTLTPNDPPAVDVAAGAGPRHFAFHPDGKHAYAINELANTINVFDYDPDKGALKTRQTISTLPKDFKKPSYTAEVVVHPSGKFVYGSNRGHDSIAIFACDPKTGELTAVGHSAEVKTPRNFAIDPTGTYLLAGAQDAGHIKVFRINQKTGELDLIGTTDVPSPVCIRMMAKP